MFNPLAVSSIPTTSEYTICSVRHGCSAIRTSQLIETAEKHANRMEVLSVGDLQERDTVKAIRRMRRQFWTENLPKETASEIYNLIGGRLSVLATLAKKPDMLAAAKHRIEREKQWLLSQIGLIPDHDDGASYSL